MFKFKRTNRKFGRNTQSNQRFENNKKPFSYRSNTPRNFSGRRKYGQSIDISKFIKKASPVSTAKIQITKNTFNDFGFVKEIENNLKYRGYNTPTPIQDQAIHHIKDGKDLIGLANTGTGKTAAFLLPLINKAFISKNEKVLIIAPTRELAQQIDFEFRQFTVGMRINSAVCVGGAPVYRQISDLRRNPSFVIGTPGRIKDLHNRRLISFTTFNNIVLDEVDRMLDMGFVEDISMILSQLPKARQSLFFSATLPPKISELVKQFLNNPITIEVKTGQTAENVDQDVVRIIDKESKFTQLQNLLTQPEMEKVLIFIETKAEVEKITNELISLGFKADSIHSNKRQSQRQRSLNLFRNNKINILVATDVAARGLDIKDITHVINYTVPQTYNDYVHRIGRTGRADSKGQALTFIDAN